MRMDRQAIATYFRKTVVDPAQENGGTVFLFEEASGRGNLHESFQGQAVLNFVFEFLWAPSHVYISGVHEIF